METRAVLRGVRLSVDKGRLVADLMRGKKVDQALNILQFTEKKAAGIVKTHAQTIWPATPQRTADSRRVAPTPTMAPVIACVVLTGAAL